jgi:hypothetical protein
MQTFLPEKTNVATFSGDKLYEIDGVNYPPQRDTGPAPECRMEISPAESKKDYVFVHVLRTAERDVTKVPSAKADVSGNKVRVTVDTGKSFDFEVR